MISIMKYSPNTTSTTLIPTHTLANRSLFSAICHQLGQHSLADCDAGELREMAVVELRDNPDLYLPFICANQGSNSLVKYSSRVFTL